MCSRIEAEKSLCNSFYEASVILIPKLDKAFPRKEKLYLLLGSPLEFWNRISMLASIFVSLAICSLKIATQFLCVSNLMGQGKNSGLMVKRTCFYLMYYNVTGWTKKKMLMNKILCGLFLIRQWRLLKTFLSLLSPPQKKRYEADKKWNTTKYRYP